MVEEIKNIIFCHECGEEIVNKNNIDSADVKYAAHKKCIDSKAKQEHNWNNKIRKV